jgi:hypothetical protein
MHSIFVSYSLQISDQPAITDMGGVKVLHRSALSPANTKMLLIRGADDAQPRAKKLLKASSESSGISRIIIVPLGNICVSHRGSPCKYGSKVRAQGCTLG